MNPTHIILGALAVMTARRHTRASSTLRGRSRTPQPWDRVQLSKSERKGKTPDELQALRQRKYEASCLTRMTARDLPDDERLAARIA